MKTSILFFLFVCASLFVAGQDSTAVKKQSWGLKVAMVGNDFQQVATSRTAGAKVATGQNVTLKDGTVVPVYKTKTGKLYIVRTSKKTGKTYNQYLEVAAK